MEQFDAIVIGGGFYGCSVALAVAKRLPRVAIFEREPDLLTRASYHNQARVHSGYHYPRSLLTAIRSAANYPRFKHEFSECIETKCTHLYAIARTMSKASAYQFKRFCEQVNIPLKSAPWELERLFNQDFIESVFCVEESVFDAVKLRVRLAEELSEAGVSLRCGNAVQRISAGIRLELRDGYEAEAKYVFNCTYSQVNQVLARSGLRTLPLKHELTEMALIEVPAPLDRVAVTVMDGPFFSVVPFPALRLHTLSHVTYTPHSSWRDDLTDGSEDGRRSCEPISKSIFMLRDAQRYLPLLKEAACAGSLFETKTVLLRNEADDGRPILCYRHPEMDGLFAILGSKIDNIYDVVRSIEAELFATEFAHVSNN